MCVWVFRFDLAIYTEGRIWLCPDALDMLDRRITTSDYRKEGLAGLEWPTLRHLNTTDLIKKIRDLLRRTKEHDRSDALPPFF